MVATNYGEERDLMNVFYALSAFFAFGIWTVVKRYQTIRNRAVHFNWAAPEAIDPEWESLKLDNPALDAHLHNPDLVPPVHITGRRYITCYDPATAFHIDTVIADNDYTIGEKIGRAGAAQAEWKHTPFADRRRLMRSLQKWLIKNAETCARVACRDTGKTMVDAALGEILVTCSKLDWLMKYGEDYLFPEKRHGNLILGYKRSEVHYEPLGVVAAVVSWNYPLHNAWSPIIAALFAGNAIVLKCSEHVAWSTQWFVGAIRQCLYDSGLNRDLVQLVYCWPDDVEALTTSPWIKHITFIGSEEVGRKVAQAAAVNLTPVTMELGGKDPAVILPGTDLNKWASVWMRGIFQNSGQNCIGIERLVVHSSQHDELVEMLAERAQGLRHGSALNTDDGFISPIDCGAMVSSARFAELEQLIDEAVEQGAELRCGGKRWRHAYHDKGLYFEPTIIGNAQLGMEVVQKELFAPVALLMKYDLIDDAVEVANGTRYGLGASVFGPNQAECIRVAKRLECGMVSINDFGVTYVNQDLPFGGAKGSGYGRFAGPEGLRSLCNTKVIVTDRWPWLIQTSIPAVLDYPIRSMQLSWSFIHGLIGFVYGDPWYERLADLIRLISAARRRPPPP